MRRARTHKQKTQQELNKCRQPRSKRQKFLRRAKVIKIQGFLLENRLPAQPQKPRDRQEAPQKVCRTLENAARERQKKKKNPITHKTGQRRLAERTP